jgi:hypothetical protein
MAISHILTDEITFGSTTIRASETVSSGSEIAISEAISANQTNQLVALAFANAKLKSIYIHSDVTMSLHTNEASTGTPQDKIFLVAGSAYKWSLTGSFLGEVGDSAASPFDGNVTALYVTNTTAGTLTIRGLVDPT